MKMHRKWLWWASSPFMLILAWYLFTQLINPLPSDEKMIDHFQAHQAEFETLAKNYRGYNPYDPAQNKILFDEIPENKYLMEKAAIIRVHELGRTWFPNPYSAEAAREFEKRRKQAGKNALDFAHPYKSIGFSMERPPFVGLYRNVILFSGMFTVMKDFMYFPEVPKIEEGLLWYPVSSSGNRTGQHTPDRVFASLNYYPFNWKRGECVYRQFEPHWFIRMCITY